jgi:hypothetical protein
MMITVKNKRDGKEQIITGTKFPYEEKEGSKATDDANNTLKDAY